MSKLRLTERARRWLIVKLAGDRVVLINARMDGKEGLMLDYSQTTDFIINLKLTNVGAGITYKRRK